MIPLTVMAAGDARDDPDQVLPRAAVVAAAWQPDPGSVAVWRYSANFLFTLTIAGERHFLRVAPCSERHPDRLAREAAMLAHLHAAGWGVPVPIPTSDSRQIASATVGDQTYHAVLLPVVPGELREVDELTPADLATWGATLGRLHTALRQLPPGTGPVRIAWHAERDLITAALPAWSPPVQAAAHRCLAWINQLPTSRAGADYGLIHGDFELDNLPWAATGPNVIDFDEAGASWYAADIAFAVRDLTQAGETITSPRLAAFLAGYASARPLPADLAEQLPRFSQWARLATLARITRARPAAPTGLPAWAAALDTRLATLAGAYEAEILAADA